MRFRIAVCLTWLPVVIAAAQPPTVALVQAPPIELKVRTNGEAAWNGLTVSDAGLREKLAALQRSGRRPQVHLRPGKGATYAQVLHVLTILQSLGIGLGMVGVERDP